MTARTSPSLPSAPAELERWRRETPGCRERIHLNNAGAGLMPQPVLQALTGHLEREATIGGYEAEDEAERPVRETYELLGRLVGAAANNVAIVENATVAFSQAVSAFDLRPGDRIVTTRADYPSNQLRYLSLARRAGVETVRADDLPEGGVDPESVRRLASHPRTRLVALTWVPTNSGLVQDARAVGEVCAELGVPYLIDACQAVGQLAVDVNALRCDFLGGTGRKFLRGPRGIGFLYVSDRMLERGAFPLFVDMRGADWTDPDAFRLADGARRFENWEFAYALVVGLGAATRYSLAVGSGGRERAQRLAAQLRRRLGELPGVRVLDRGREQCAIVTIGVAGRNAVELKLKLRERGINTSSADRKDGVLDMDDKRVTTVLRLSPHYYNTDDELDTAVGALAELVRA
jgi:selenocysteine lyase/cysteine desulfurase